MKIKQKTQMNFNVNKNSFPPFPYSLLIKTPKSGLPVYFPPSLSMDMAFGLQSFSQLHGLIFQPRAINNQIF